MNKRLGLVFLFAYLIVLYFLRVGNFVSNSESVLLSITFVLVILSLHSFTEKQKRRK